MASLKSCVQRDGPHPSVLIIASIVNAFVMPSSSPPRCAYMFTEVRVASGFSSSSCRCAQISHPKQCTTPPHGCGPGYSNFVSGTFAYRNHSLQNYFVVSDISASADISPHLHVDVFLISAVTFSHCIEKPLHLILVTLSHFS